MADTLSHTVTDHDHDIHARAATLAPAEPRDRAENDSPNAYTGGVENGETRRPLDR